ncbi:MAG: hypothetical protein AB8G26_14450 [Ilumatobacter sp.]
MRPRQSALRHEPGARQRRRIAAGVLAGTLAIAACGGDDASTGSEALPEVGGIDASGGDPTLEADNVPVEIADGAAMVDLVGADVQAASQIETNLLPDVVIDDLSNDRKVNFRNLVPQDKPILLWMYAPH